MPQPPGQLFGTTVLKHLTVRSKGDGRITHHPSGRRSTQNRNLGDPAATGMITTQMHDDIDR